MANMKSTQSAAHTPAFRLVPPAARPPCVETVLHLEELLRRARAGEIRGIADVVLLPGKGYSVDAIGAFRRDPTFARGAIAALDDEMRELVHERAMQTAED